MTKRFHDPDLYKHLEEATKATSELLHDIDNKNRDYRGGGTDSKFK